MRLWASSLTRWVLFLAPSIFARLRLPLISQPTKKTTATSRWDFKRGWPNLRRGRTGSRFGEQLDGFHWPLKSSVLRILTATTADVWSEHVGERMMSHGLNTCPVLQRWSPVGNQKLVSGVSRNRLRSTYSAGAATLHGFSLKHRPRRLSSDGTTLFGGRMNRKAWVASTRQTPLGGNIGYAAAKKVGK